MKLRREKKGLLYIYSAHYNIPKIKGYRNQIFNLGFFLKGRLSLYLLVNLNFSPPSVNLKKLFTIMILTKVSHRKRNSWKPETLSKRNTNFSFQTEIGEVSFIQRSRFPRLFALFFNQENISNSCTFLSWSEWKGIYIVPLNDGRENKRGTVL